MLLSTVDKNYFRVASQVMLRYVAELKSHLHFINSTKVLYARAWSI